MDLGSSNPRRLPLYLHPVICTLQEPSPRDGETSSIAMAVWEPGLFHEPFHVRSSPGRVSHRYLGIGPSVQVQEHWPGIATFHPESVSPVGTKSPPRQMFPVIRTVVAALGTVKCE
jgi:hypothetical protein